MFNIKNNLRSEIFGLFLSKTFQSTGVVFAGNLIASGFSLITILIFTRTLGPEIFGIISLISSVALLLISLTDFGIAVGLSKFVTPITDKTSPKVVSFFRIVFWIEVIIGLMLILFGLFFLDPLSDWLGGSHIKEPLVLGFIIAGVLSLNAYVPSILQALQRFWTITLLNVLSNFIKLLIVLILLFTGYLSLWNILYTNLFTAITILLIGFLIIPKLFISRINWKEDINSVGILFSFTKWLAVSYALNAAAARLDVLMLSHFRNTVEVGYYALAFQLSSIFPLLLGAIATVLIPKVSTLQTNEQLGKYIKKSIIGSLFIIPLILIGIIAGPSLISILFGQRFIGSTPILQILLLNYTLILIINPISFVMYALNKQKILTLMNALTLVTLFVLQIYLIPRLGGIGAALALLFNTSFAMIIMVYLLVNFSKQGKIKI